MSVGSLASLGGVLSAGPPSNYCACEQINPIGYPPNPCCNDTGNGNGCGNGSGGGDGLGPLGTGIRPPNWGGGGGQGDGCCSDNGGGPFMGPTGGGSGSGNGNSCGCGNGGGQGNGWNSPSSGMGSGSGGNIMCWDGTYGVGGASRPMRLGNPRNGAVILPNSPGPPGGGITPTQPCVAPSGTQPPAVPSSSSPFSIDAEVKAGPNLVQWLLITCVETGVTLPAGCVTVRFYQTTSGSKTFTTPGGTGKLCVSDPNPHNYSSGSASGTTGTTVQISVTQV